jgi:hypothetical protein
MHYRYGCLQAHPQPQDWGGPGCERRHGWPPSLGYTCCLCQSWPCSCVTASKGREVGASQATCYYRKKICFQEYTAKWIQISLGKEPQVSQPQSLPSCTGEKISRYEHRSLFPWLQALGILLRKNCFIFFLYSHTLITTEDFWDPKRCGDFSSLASKQASNSAADTSLVFSILIQFWSCLPRDTVSSHRLRAQSPRPPSPFMCHLQAPGCFTDQPTMNWGSHDPFLRFN